MLSHPRSKHFLPEELRILFTQLGLHDPAAQHHVITSASTIAAGRAVVTGSQPALSPSDILAVYADRDTASTSVPLLPIDKAAQVSTVAELFSGPATATANGRAHSPSGAVKVSEARIKEREDFLYEWFLASTNRLPISKRQAAIAFAKHVEMSEKQIMSVFYGQESLAPVRVLSCIESGKLSIANSNPLVLLGEKQKEKWDLDTIQTWQKRATALTLLRTMLPWHHTTPSIELVQSLFGIQTRIRAGQVVLGRVHAATSRVIRVQTALRQLGYDPELVSEATSPFMSDQGLVLTVENQSAVAAERRYALEQMHLLLTGENIRKEKPLRGAWASRLGMSPVSMDFVGMNNKWLDIAPSQALCKIICELHETKGMAIEDGTPLSFFGNSKWYQRTEPEYPEALSCYRKMVDACLCVYSHRLSYPGGRIGLDAALSRVGFDERELSADLLNGSRHLLPSQIQALSEVLMQLGMNGEVAWLFCPLGCAWATSGLLKPMRKVISRHMIESVRKFDEKDPFFIETTSASRKRITSGDGISDQEQLTLLKLISHRENREQLARLGGKQTVAFLFKIRS